MSVSASAYDVTWAQALVQAPPLPHRSARSHTIQRVMDLLGAATLLLLIAPLLLLIGLGVRSTSPGAILFRQVRVGLDGREFTMLKFRTMHAFGHARRDELRSLDEGNGVLFKIRRDPRVTRLGRVLRRLSFDELPQLLNVLRGDMSLVGPRPALPEEVATYTTTERHRLHVRPGVTGLWQVSGRSDLSWDSSVQLDLHYVRHSSAWLDVKILLRTVLAVVHGRGAY